MTQKVAIFVDGDNLSARFAPDIIRKAKSYGTISLARVYGGSSALNGWSDCYDFQFVYSGSGKNAADLHLAIQATEYTLTQSVDVAVLCTSDADLTHLARSLRERGILVIGCGQEKANQSLRRACTDFSVLCIEPEVKPTACASVRADLSDLDLRIRTTIASHSQNGSGMRITELSQIMYRKFGTKISEHPEGNWRSYLVKRDTLFDLDPKGRDAMVRFIPTGFSA